METGYLGMTYTVKVWCNGSGHEYRGLRCNTITERGVFLGLNSSGHFIRIDPGDNLMIVEAEP